MTDLEILCRIICEAENVDPDQESTGLGNLIPEGQKYKLWEARKRVAEAILASDFWVYKV